MKRKFNQFIANMKRISPGFWRRFIILTLVYFMVMIGVWSIVGKYLLDGTDNPWILGIIFGVSGLLYIGMIVYVEIANHRKRI